MLLNTFEFIEKLQSEIGNDARVWVHISDGRLEIRVDWWGIDFHARRSLSKTELEKLDEEEDWLNYFVSWCKHHYDKKMERDLLHTK
ncbi:MAG: hypothetical protein WBC34_09535 [Thiofilum sp.]